MSDLILSFSILISLLTLVNLEIWYKGNRPIIAPVKLEDRWDGLEDSAEKLLNFLIAHVDTPSQKEVLENDRAYAIKDPAFRVASYLVGQMSQLNKENEKELEKIKIEKDAISGVIDDRINVFNKKHEEIIELLNYSIIDKLNTIISSNKNNGGSGFFDVNHRDIEEREIEREIPKEKEEEIMPLSKLSGPSVFSTLHKTQEEGEVESRIIFNNLEAKELKIDGFKHEMRTKVFDTGYSANRAGGMEKKPAITSQSYPSFPLFKTPDPIRSSERLEKIQMSSVSGNFTPKYLSPTPILYSIYPIHILFSEGNFGFSGEDINLPNIQKIFLGNKMDYSRIIKRNQLIIVEQNLVCSKENICLPFTSFLNNFINENGSCSKYNSETYKEKLSMFYGISFEPNYCS